ncbi:MAG: hypothetical protein AAF567_06865 [Actinomycetota bacterium]
MSVHAPSGSRGVLGGEDLLHSVEELLAHERFVLSLFDDLALVAHLAGVVWVPQDSAERGLLDRLWLIEAAAWLAAEAPGVKHDNQIVEAVATSRIGLEGPRDVWRPVLIDGHGPVFVSVGGYCGGVEVADRCTPRRTAAPGLLLHAGGGADGVAHVFVLGVGHKDSLHHLTFGSVIDVLGSRNQRDPALLQLTGQERIIAADAGPAVDLEQDDVIDVADFANAFHKSLKFGALGGLGGLGEFDIDLDDVHAHVFGSLHAALLLRRDREADPIAGSLGLLVARDSKVENGSVPVGHGVLLSSVSCRLRRRAGMQLGERPNPICCRFAARERSGGVSAPA